MENDWITQSQMLGYIGIFTVIYLVTWKMVKSYYYAPLKELYRYLTELKSKHLIKKCENEA